MLGKPLPLAVTLRLHHGALAALLVPVPTTKIVHAIRTILAAHNPLEEGPDGVYEQCRNLSGSEADLVLRQLEAAKDVPVATRLDTPKVMEGIRKAVVRAGFSEDLLD